MNNSRPAVLIYNLPQSAALIALLDMQGIYPIAVPKSGYMLPLSELLSENFVGSAAVGDIKEPMMIMHGFTDEQLSDLLCLLRTNGIKIGLKAVTTPTNLGWNSLQLYAHLCAEREAFFKNKK